MVTVFIEFEFIYRGICSVQYCITTLSDINYLKLYKIIDNSPGLFSFTFHRYGEQFKFLINRFDKLTEDEFFTYKKVFKFNDTNFNTLKSPNIREYLLSFLHIDEIDNLINYIFDPNRSIVTPYLRDLQDLYELYNENSICDFNLPEYSYTGLLKYKKFLSQWLDYVNYEMALAEVPVDHNWDKNLYNIIGDYLNNNPCYSIEEDEITDIYFCNPENRKWLKLTKLTRKALSKSTDIEYSEDLLRYMDKLNINIVYKIRL